MINRRRGHFERIFETLARPGSSGATSIWPGTSRSRAIRTSPAARCTCATTPSRSLGDTNLADLAVAGQAPPFQVTQVETFTPAQNAQLARRVKGTVSVPCYLAPNCAPGGRFQLDARGLPTRNGTWDANFDCIIPRSAVAAGSSPARPSLYGHGLFGRAAEVGSSGQRELANTYNFVLCATDEIGMSQSRPRNGVADHERHQQLPEARGPVAAGTAERALSRARDDPPAGARQPPGVPGRGTAPSVIDTSRLYYDGNSQGGIMGGALTALAPDFTQAALGVPAMRYSLLVPRSVDFDQFAALLYPNYPDELVRPLILSLIQMLWDRGEPNGYATG